MPNSSFMMHHQSVDSAKQASRHANNGGHQLLLPPHQQVPGRKTKAPDQSGPTVRTLCAEMAHRGDSLCRWFQSQHRIRRNYCPALFRQVTHKPMHDQLKCIVVSVEKSLLRSRQVETSDQSVEAGSSGTGKCMRGGLVRRLNASLGLVRA